MVAGGVETDHEMEELRRFGCYAFQGYLCARPMPADAFRDWLAGARHRPAGVRTGAVRG